MCLGKVLVEFNSTLRRVNGGQKTFLGRQYAHYAQPIVIIRDPGIGVRVVWIGCDRTVKAYERLCKTLFRKRIKVIPPSKIIFECLRVVGAAFYELIPLVRSQLRQQAIDNFGGEFVLQRE